MAYAQKAPTLPVGFGVPGPVWFGYEPENVPFARSVAGAKDEEVMRVARAHLAKALQVYREAMELAPDNYAIKLGYGWCLEQSGEKAQAITVYRAVIATAWRTEKDMRSLGLGRPLTSEAAGYLISLLDPERDRDEIVTLRERMAQIARQPRAITPVAVPLTSDVRSESLIDASVRVTFDADGSGLPKSWTWISPKAGWLVWKPSREQRVTSALQMFGNVTFWLFWKNGYEAMRALDDNHDGQLAGAELDGLAIWQDRNSNGVDDEGEVQPLYVWGIAALSCGYDSTPLSTDYAAMSANGVTFTDGRTRPTYDILLYERPERTAISGLKP
jgi:tetratricopeptide (TPR) repeat protein